MSETRIGTVLGGAYRLERLLGEGGFGSVYEAAHVRLPRRFAVKLLNADVVGNAEVLERFRREAEIASALGHEHIVQVFDFNVAEDGAPFMVLELLEGEDLEHRLGRRGPLTLDETCDVLGQVAPALDLAHTRGIVHRDLKPSNFFLCPRAGRDFVKLLDFGISKVQASHMTRTGALLGTPCFMSPEQALGQQGEVDHRTDLFALGAILYQCLSGRLPFQGETPAAVLYQICYGEAPPLTAVAPGVPEPVARVVAHALARRRDDRPASVGLLHAELVAAARGAPSAPRVRPIHASRLPLVLLAATAAAVVAIAVRLILLASH